MSKKYKTNFKAFAKDYIHNLLNQPMDEIWPALNIVAQQNELNLCDPADLEEAAQILVKSIILN
tara:strand:+ start:822 stop:1013 length:192 start_codon:yes stop_codon:yes gene_type:complete